MSDGAEDYYMCECTSCRNLGNSVDVCCQCCACAEEESAAASAVAAAAVAGTPRYQVASMALTGEADDTLEVCLNNYEVTTEEEEEEEDDDEEEAEVKVVAPCQNCHSGGGGVGGIEVAAAASQRHYHPHKVCKAGRVFLRSLSLAPSLFIPWFVGRCMVLFSEWCPFPSFTLVQ